MNAAKTRQQIPNLLGTPGGIVTNKNTDAASAIKGIIERKNEPPPALTKKEADGLWEQDYWHNW